MKTTVLLFALILSAAPASASQAVASLRLTIYIQHTVTLRWTASSGATSYNVYVSLTHGGPYQRIGSGIASTTWIDARENSGQTLYYVVTAVNAGGESTFSDEVAAVIPIP